MQIDGDLRTKATFTVTQIRTIRNFHVEKLQARHLSLLFLQSRVYRLASCEIQGETLRCLPSKRLNHPSVQSKPSDRLCGLGFHRGIITSLTAHTTRARRSSSTPA